MTYIDQLKHDFSQYERSVKRIVRGKCPGAEAEILNPVRDFIRTVEQLHEHDQTESNTMDKRLKKWEDMAGRTVERISHWANTCGTTIFMTDCTFIEIVPFTNHKMDGVPDVRIVQ